MKYYLKNIYMYICKGEKAPWWFSGKKILQQDVMFRHVAILGVDLNY